MGDLVKRTDGPGNKDEDFYSRKARRNQEDIDKLAVLLNAIINLNWLNLTWLKSTWLKSTWRWLRW